MPEKTYEAAQRFSLDDFLKEQSKAVMKVTIEAIADKQDSVKLTPYVSGKGCLCNLSISVPRASVKSVGLTGETHLCCGKALRVVQVEFAEGQSITYSEMLEQLSTTAMSGHQEHVAPVSRHQPPSRRSSRGQLLPLGARVLSPFDGGECESNPQASGACASGCQGQTQLGYWVCIDALCCG
jgi:hypothetical protein